ncbi:MAG: DUF1127 domain-containing protein [Chromatiaceae bacterium]|jgi:uncharacterized protein YjiS (DUF1127 family)|nr:DUF1127 domain-containing protein [Chromatiaceae bacterium]
MTTLTLSHRLGDGASWIEPTQQAVQLIRAWQQRATQRRQLACLSEPQLRDIGISRGEALREAAKPFWRA